MPELSFLGTRHKLKYLKWGGWLLQNWVGHYFSTCQKGGFRKKIHCIRGVSW